MKLPRTEVWHIGRKIMLVELPFEDRMAVFRGVDVSYLPLTMPGAFAESGDYGAYRRKIIADLPERISVLKDEVQGILSEEASLDGSKLSLKERAYGLAFEYGQERLIDLHHRTAMRYAAWSLLSEDTGMFLSDLSKHHPRGQSTDSLVNAFYENLRQIAAMGMNNSQTRLSRIEEMLK